MRENKGNQSPKNTRILAEDFFAEFDFSTKRSLYLPKTVIHSDRPDGQQQHNRKRISRVIRGWVPCITVLILAVNAIIYAQQCGIMKQQSITANSQTTIMATQAVIMRDTLPQMQAQASAAVEAAHAEATSAAAAKQAAQTAKDTLYLTESPDIEVQIECSTQAFGLDTRLTLHYRNAGRTRAVGFAQAFNPGFPAIRPFINHTTSIGPLSAGSTKPSGTTPTVREMLQYFKPTVTPEKAFQDIRSGTMAFSFWGIATYKDMLNNPHTFEFQYEWDRVWPNKCDFILVKADAN